MPVERIELPTFGLQNRCTTAVLHRPDALLAAARRPFNPSVADGVGSISVKVRAPKPPRKSRAKSFGAAGRLKSGPPPLPHSRHRLFTHNSAISRDDDRITALSRHPGTSSQKETTMLKRKLLGGALAALTLGAVVAGNAAPASAQWRDGPYGYYGRGYSPGAAAAAGAIGGLALGAALAAPTSGLRPTSALCLSAARLCRAAGGMLRHPASGLGARLGLGSPPRARLRGLELPVWRYEKGPALRGAFFFEAGSSGLTPTRQTVSASARRRPRRCRGPWSPARRSGR